MGEFTLEDIKNFIVASRPHYSFHADSLDDLCYWNNRIVLNNFIADNELSRDDIVDYLMNLSQLNKDTKEFTSQPPPDYDPQIDMDIAGKYGLIGVASDTRTILRTYVTNEMDILALETEEKEGYRLITKELTSNFSLYTGAFLHGNTIFIRKNYIDFQMAFIEAARIQVSEGFENDMIQFMHAHEESHKKYDEPDSDELELKVERDVRAPLSDLSSYITYHKLRNSGNGISSLVLKEI